MRVAAAMTWHLAALALLAGCDRLQVQSFAGAKILLTLDGADPTPPGRHLELWVRTRPPDGPPGATDHVVRVLAAEGDRLPDGTPCAPGVPGDAAPACPRAAYALVPAADLDDGCLIDREGHLLWKPDALDAHGAPQGQPVADAILERIRQLTTRVARPLVALVAWDDRSAMRPRLDESLTAEQRLARCNAFWSLSPFTYTGNPVQLTRPIHGPFLGTVDFQSTTPPQILGGIRVVTDWSLHDAVEIWLTETEATIAQLDPHQIDCRDSPATCRGRVLLDGDLTELARGALHAELRSTTVPGLKGAAAIQTRLDEAPEPF